MKILITKCNSSCVEGYTSLFYIYGYYSNQGSADLLPNIGCFKKLDIILYADTTKTTRSNQMKLNRLNV